MAWRPLLASQCPRWGSSYLDSQRFDSDDAAGVSNGGGLAVRGTKTEEPRSRLTSSA